MLVLAHANRLGVNLDQLGQGVLQAPRNAGRTAQAHIHVRHFLAGVFTGAVDRGTRLTHHHFVHRLAAGLGNLFDQVACKLVGLSAGGAVADGNQVDAMAHAQGTQGMQSAVPVLARLVGKNGGGIHQFASRVDHGHFHPRANAGVQAHHHAGPGGCGQEQVTHIVGKDLDGNAFGIFAQTCKQVALQGQAELDAPGPGHAFADQVIRGTPLVAPAQPQRNPRLGQRYDRALGFSGRRIRRNQCQRGIGQHQFGVQNIQCATAKHGQSPVRRHATDGLVVGKVIAKLGHVGMVFVFAFHALALQQALIPQPGA